MLKCITSVLEEDITADIQNRCGLEAADRQIRERGKEAKQIKGILCCQSTLLELAGLCDIYNLFGTIVNVSQVKLFLLDFWIDEQITINLFTNCTSLFYFSNSETFPTSALMPLTKLWRSWTVWYLTLKTNNVMATVVI